MTFYHRNLPHWHPEGKPIFLTWRLHGSLPASILKSSNTAKNGCATKGHNFKLVDQALDTTVSGPLYLKDPRIASHIIETLHKGANQLNYFELHAYVVMPNHIHLLLTPRIPLPRITNGIKGATSRYAKSLLNLKQKHFWQDESFDHWPRNPKEFDRLVRYIEHNPVAANLTSTPESWPWSSAAKH